MEVLVALGGIALLAMAVGWIAAPPGLLRWKLRRALSTLVVIGVVLVLVWAYASTK